MVTKIFKAFLGLFFFALFLSLPFLVMAQDATDSTGTGGGGLPFELPKNVVVILTVVLSIYEVIVRIMPTVKNYSIIGFLIKLIQTVIPNRTTTQVLQKKADAAQDKANGEKPQTAPPPALP